MGGDSVSTAGPVVLSVTAFGQVRTGQALRRAAAKPGDRIFVSGTVGDGALGLMAARGELADLDSVHADALAARYPLPTPRTALGPPLVGLANACLDLSAGLPGALAHVCAASGVGARAGADRGERAR